MRKENNSYEKDLYHWAQVQSSLLKKGDFEKLDLKNIIEELEDLGTSQRSALESQMTRLLMHLLKIKFQPNKHSKSWDRSIGNAKIKIERILRKNPSLKRELPELVVEAYYFARKEARNETGLSIDTFPEKCPWTLSEIFEDD